MDSITKQILQKFSTQKVDLGIMQDANKLINDISSGQKNSNSLIDSSMELISKFAKINQEAGNEKKNIDKQIENLKKLISRSEKIISKYKSTTSDLGVEPNKIKEYQIIDGAIGTLNAIENSLQSYSNDLKKYI